MERYESLSVEKKIVILGSRISNLDKERLSALVAGEPNWEKVTEYAMRNKVLYVLCENLIRCQLEQYIPNHLKKLVETAKKGNVVSNNIKLLEVERVSKVMERSGVKIVPVKGAYLIDNIYADRSIRTSNDVDALISKKDISQIDKIMKDLGYTTEMYDKKTNQLVQRSAAQKMLYKTKMYNLLPYRKCVEDSIEEVIIFDYSHSLDFSLDTRPVEEMINNSFYTGKTWCLLPEHFFVHMCCHHYREASHTEWIRLGKDLNLIKFCDVREFVLQKMNRESMENAIKFVKNYNLEKALYFTLYFLRVIYNDGYESEWLERLEVGDASFVFEFGENEYEYIQTRKKSFWNSFFDVDNMEELNGNTKYDEFLK